MATVNSLVRNITTMINVNIHKTSLTTLRPNDPDFILNDGIKVSPRAGFEISQRCPTEYKMILQDCIRYGWITPIATVYNWELTYSRLKND